MNKIVQLSVLIWAYNIAFSQAGNLDTSFRHDGRVITQFNSPAVLHAMALQADGKIIAAGTTDSLFTIVRYNTNGSTDKSFGNNGIVKGLRGEANAVAIQDNGRIIVAGTTFKQHGYKINYNVTVAQYNSHGSIDSGFGNNGSVTIDLREFDYCKSVVIQQDGKIVLAGTTDGKVLLIRLNKDGGYDTNFGDSGKVNVFADEYGYDVSSAIIRTMALQPDGKIIVGGYGTDANSEDFLHPVLMRFKKNGHIDTSFGYDGRANFYGISINDIAVQSDGKIVCAGIGHHVYWNEYGYYFVADPALARYTADGIIDTTYGSNGYVYVLPREGDLDAELYSVALLPNDESVSTLQYIPSDERESDTTLAVFKFNTKGEKDSLFGSNGGKVFANPYLHTNSYLQLSGIPSTPILVQPDGKIVVGSTYDSSDFYIARLLASKTQNKDLYSAAQETKNITTVQAGVYPNPAHDILAIKGLNVATSSRLTITDMQGRIYKSADVKNSSTFTFNIQNLPPATYMLIIQSAASTETISFIKQ